MSQMLDFLAPPRSSPTKSTGASSLAANSQADGDTQMPLLEEEPSEDRASPPGL